MKIGILGTRGIPNRYGGFEQFADYLSAGLAEKGHQVFVYNPHHHDFQGEKLGGVHIIHCNDPEPWMGTAGQFIYDLNCIRDSRQRDFDVLLLLGYTSSSIWNRYLPPKAVIISNMDGLEWKRAKYSSPVKRFLKAAEKWAVNGSDVLVADSPAIQEYLEEKYGVASAYIPYAAEVFTYPDAKKLQPLELQPYAYDLIIARMEPENHVAEIIEGYSNAEVDRPLVIVGNTQNRFGKRLKNYIQHSLKLPSQEGLGGGVIKQIIFAGPIYDQPLLDNLRHFSYLYFHGHSVGGTNPSLLEAMAAGALIVAHDNPFNRQVVGEQGFYFKNERDISALVNGVKREEWRDFILANQDKIACNFSLERVVDGYETLMLETLAKMQKR